MMRIALAATAAAVIVTAGSPFAGVTPAKAENLKMAQVQIEVGRDRDVREDRRHRDREPGATVGVGPGGIVVGPQGHCRMVTTTVERDDGRRVTRKERVCD
jgi:hypothetical protein